MPGFDEPFEECGAIIFVDGEASDERCQLHYMHNTQPGAMDVHSRTSKAETPISQSDHKPRKN